MKSLRRNQPFDKVFDRRVSFIAMIPCLAVLLSASVASVGSAQQGTSSGTIQSFDLQHAKADKVAEILNEQFRIYQLEFSGNPDTNKVYGRVPESLIPQVKEFAATLEQDAAERQRIVSQAISNRAKAGTRSAAPASRRLKVFALRFVRADDALDVIKELAMDGEDVSVAAEARTNSLIALGKPAELEKIEALLLAFDQSTGDTSDPFSDNTSGSDQLRRRYQQSLDKLGPSHPMVREHRLAWEESIRDPQITEAAPVRAEDLLTLNEKYKAVELSVDHLAKQVRQEKASDQPDSERVATLVDQLRQRVQTTFQLRQQLKELQLRQAAQQLEVIRQRLRYREKISEAIVNRRVEQLINQPESEPIADRQRVSEETINQRLESLMRGTDANGPTDEQGPLHPDSDKLSSGKRSRTTDHSVQVETMVGGIIVLKGERSDVETIAKAMEGTTKQNPDSSDKRKILGSVNSVDPFAEDQVVLKIDGDVKLREGDQVEVLQNGRPIARLKVTRVSGARVEAQIADKTGFIELGDEVRLTEDSTNQADDTAEDEEQ